MIIETFEDGWDCLPELKEVVETIEELDTYKYEINNCVRVTDGNEGFTRRSIK